MRLLILSLAALTVLVTVACGDDDDTTGQGPPPAATFEVDSTSDAIDANLGGDGTVVGSSPAADDARSPTDALPNASELDRLDFNEPVIIKSLVSGDFRVLRLSEDNVHIHIVGMNQVFEVACPLQYDHSITTVATNRVLFGADGTAMQRRLEEGLSIIAEALRSGSIEDVASAVTSPSNRTDIAVSRAQQDALKLVTTYGCDSRVFATFYGNMGTFVKSQFATTGSIPLHEAKVFDLTWGALQTIFLVPSAQRDAVSRQVAEVKESGQQVIKCTYGPSDPQKNVGFTVWDFWYEGVPGNIVEMLQSAPSGTHPMWRLGLNSITECPESPELALQERRSGMIP